MKTRHRWLIIALVGSLLAGCIVPPPYPDPRGAVPLDEEPDRHWLLTLLESDPRLAAVVSEAEKHRLQLLIAEVVETEDGPILRRSGFRVDAEYFYPASTIKLYAAIAALEWLEEESTPSEVTLDTAMRIHPLFDDESLDERDPSNLEGATITIGHEVRKLCIVSDNTAFNRLFEFLGPDDLHARLARAGFPDVLIRHRLSEFRSLEQNRMSPRIEFVVGETTLHTLPERRATEEIPLPDHRGLQVGDSFLRSGNKIETSMDFTHKNLARLVDLQNALVATVRPDIPLEAADGTPQQFRLSDEHRAHLVRALSEWPRESENPLYDREKYPDDWVKFLLPGLKQVVPQEELTISNKVGLAYGFTIENAYVHDRGTGRSFFLTGALYTNENATLNDGVYEYDTVAFPFWAALGEGLARTLLRPAP